ncbi:unnamed protein product [Paramecium sonneborni]|uniref:Uncharacterized protein n=1 Tax=Paramecium sonneborni TaxID=65129 RepID=A0A8S1K8V1_9CILI|nr:unnamed protein product [Paramecium sonneborni]
MNYHNNIAAGLQHKVELKKIEPKIKSILKKAQDNQNDCKTRTDWNGNPICKNSKKYSISFKQNLFQVKVVENWKKYNILDNSNLLLEKEQKKECMNNCYLF